MNRRKLTLNRPDADPGERTAYIDWVTDVDEEGGIQYLLVFDSSGDVACVYLTEEERETLVAMLTNKPYKKHVGPNPVKPSRKRAMSL